MSLANFLVNEFNKSKSLGDNPVTRETKLLMKKANQKSEDEVSENLKHTVDILNFINKTEQEMIKVRNLGRKSLEEVKIKLQELELGFKEE